MKHISVRVPWHDNGWNSHVCANPRCNTFCKQLPNIVNSKVDCEQLSCGIDWSKLTTKERPACAGENGGFMNYKAYEREFIHIYAWNSDNPHSKLLPTKVMIPAYSALGIPFRYLNMDAQKDLSKEHPEFRPAESAPFGSAWVYNPERLYDVLKWFSSEITEESICVFYCKKGNPIDDEGLRMIVGMGDIVKNCGVQDYETTADYTYPLWEIMFSHSIRPDLKESRGFILPYKEYLELDENIFQGKGLSKIQALDEIKLSLDKFDSSGKIFDELSYGCDFISNHSMLLILEAARRSLEAVIRHGLAGSIEGWQCQLRWIDARIEHVKKQITPFPSFASALKALGIDYGNLIESDLRKKGCGPKDNPWGHFEKLLNKEIKVDSAVYNSSLPTYRISWEGQTSNVRERLITLSRFELESDVIEHFIDDVESDILSNPYLISEWCARNFIEKVSTRTIDLGAFPDPTIQGDNVPVPPFAAESILDTRRLRSLVVERLYSVLTDGDTLVSIKEMEDYLRDIMTEEDKARLPKNILLTHRQFFEVSFDYVPDENPTAIQLKEYYQMEEFLRKVLRERAKRDVKKPTGEDWLSLAMSDKNYDPTNERSQQATEQQAKALEMMDKKRLSVLTGGAGTGKTTVVRSFLCSDKIKAEGVLLLAPTGKARVRLSNMAENVSSKTVAQFLASLGAFDFENMKPRLTEDSRKYSRAKNIIIDECSMLTTDTFHALIMSLDLKFINRIILIGDPYQLPPIGPGRAFSDLCHYLNCDDADANLKSAITYLRTVVRTIASGDSDVLTLASWFSGNKPEKFADEIFWKIESKNLKGDLSVYYWNDEKDLPQILRGAICKELACSDVELPESLKQKIGIDDLKSLESDPAALENLQILAPVINPAWGTYQLNSYLQSWVGNNINRKGDYQEIGTQKIYKNDKVIQLQNILRESYPSKEKYPLSNGQIGFVKSINKGHINVMYVGIPHETFGFRGDKGEDQDAAIELAYAITIHKSQGSDFDTVFVVLPKTGRILSRELIYTTLTRAKKRVVLLVQDSIGWLREFTKPQASVLARRNTNLFDYSVRAERLNIPYVEGLIHGTAKKGLFVRSKSEVVIVNQLVNAGVEFEYEQLLEENGHRCIPDFSFETPWGDRIIWEHLGMLVVPEYKASWERKLKFYEEIGYTLGENLFTTCDHENGAIMTEEVEDVIRKIKEQL